jgi:hypothetical protein
LKSALSTVQSSSWFGPSMKPSTLVIMETISLPKIDPLLKRCGGRPPHHPSMLPQALRQLEGAFRYRERDRYQRTLCVGSGFRRRQCPQRRGAAGYLSERSWLRTRASDHGSRLSRTRRRSRTRTAAHDAAADACGEDRQRSVERLASAAVLPEGRRPETEASAESDALGHHTYPFYFSITTFHGPSVWMKNTASSLPSTFAVCDALFVRAKYAPGPSLCSLPSTVSVTVPDTIVT